MVAERYEEIGGKIVEEFIWNGKRVVYVDNFLSDMTFEAACEAAEDSFTPDEPFSG